jgi:hypothetical protein
VKGPGTLFALSISSRANRRSQSKTERLAAWRFAEHRAERGKFDAPIREVLHDETSLEVKLTAVARATVVLRKGSQFDDGSFLGEHAIW